MTQGMYYRLGRYKIIEKENGEICWETHAGFGRLRTGKCFIIDQILFIGPYRMEEPGFLRGEFIEHLNKFPKWGKTKYYCSSYTIYNCKTGRMSRNFGAGGDSASKTQTKKVFGIKEKFYEVPAPKPLNFTRSILKIKEKSDAIWKLIKDRIL